MPPTNKLSNEKQRKPVYSPVSWCAIALVILLAKPSGLFGQNPRELHFAIHGLLLDSAHGKPLAYATLALLGEGGETVSNAYSTEEGAFVIGCPKPGRYRLEISSVGYTTWHAETVLSAEQPSVNLGRVLLAAAGSTLQDVTVTARRRLVEQRPGMLVYNAENDVTNKGGTAADVLRKTPILIVDAQGNVSMRGNSNLKILINGKYSGQIARNPADALNMIPSDMIKSVEVITTPSAKYDAEGAAGVINIITKKSRQALEGTLELVASNREQAFNPRLSLGGEKWSASLHGHVHRLRTEQSVFTNRVQEENGEPSLLLQQQTRQDNYAPHGSQDLAVNYQADSLTQINLDINTRFGNWPTDNRMTVALSDAQGNAQGGYTQSTKAGDRYFSNDISAGLTRKFRRAGQGLDVLAQFSPSNDRSPYEFWQTDDDGAPLYRETNNNRTRNREWTGQVDYQQPVSKDGRLILESGAKAILRQVSNRYQVFSGNGSSDSLAIDPSRSDHFLYHQNVWAGYAMFKATLPKNWYGEAGLRFEQTDIRGRLIAADTAFTSRFANLIPTATISKKITADQTITASYTRRLTRPYIWDLSSNVNASDPKNISTGNPRLQPELATQAELAYGLSPSGGFFLNASVFFKQTDNAIVSYTRIDTSGVTITSKQNLASNQTWGLNLSTSATIRTRWSLTGNLNINYLDFRSAALQIMRGGWGADIGLNGTLALDHGYSVQAFGHFSSRETTLQGYQTSHYYYSAGMKKNLRKQHMVAALSIVNPFGAYVPQTEFTQAVGFTDKVRSQYYNRAVKLTVSWDFGHGQREGARRKIRNDDVADPTRK